MHQTTSPRPTECRTDSPSGLGSAALGAILAAGLLAAGCGGHPGLPLVERVDSAGIALVINRGEDRPLDWRFERILSLGGADAGVEAFHNVGRGAVTVGSDGLLYVLDRGNHRVVVFDDRGGHVRTLSRRGGGPGELQWPQWIVVDVDGDLVITDFGHGGLVRMTAAGEPLEHRSLENWRGGAVARFGDGLVVQVDVTADGAASHELRALDPGGIRALVTAPATPLRPVDFGCVRIGGLSQLFSPSLIWAAADARLVAVSTADYDLELYTPNGLLARVRRDVPARRATRELAVQEVGDEFQVAFGGGGGCSVEPARVVEERGFADHIPAIRRVAIAPDGTLWVLRFAVRGDPAAIDIFAADGEYLGTLPAEAPFPEAFFPDGRIIAVETDDMDLTHVVLYRLALETKAYTRQRGPMLAAHPVPDAGLTESSAQARLP
jgi:hypothetical protein